MSATVYRYEVGANSVGVLDTCAKKQDAVAAVYHLALTQPTLDGIYIFDCLARVGNCNLWYYSPAADCIHAAGTKERG